ncbi:S41 family peptidase [Desulfoluna butyratoxydans]|uniref:Tail specific protease n=1 Tax=Desulfoluna butyratoxydans TaxID=231438 RepID=A0A4U8YQZ9_9BACT|nr:S41 family peptidase [Desulfoluna butyratoxydans]VFQ46301.1 tail specific protease [Desulfoluna butyratoxydans]
MTHPWIHGRLQLILTSLAVFIWGGAALAGNAPAQDQLFGEITGIVETHFFDPHRIKKGFPAIKEQYRPQILGASPEAIPRLVNAMLGELNASHTSYLTTDDPEYYYLAALFFRIPEIGALFPEKGVLYPTVGVFTQRVRGRVHVTCLLAGGVAEKAGILKGDEILSVNGKPFTPVAALRPLVGTDAVFEVRRKKATAPFSVTMQPVLMNPKEEMLAAQKASVRVMEKEGRRIGYIHIYSYAGEEYHKALRNALAWGPLKDADALIIDLRYGLGGAWPSYLNIFNRNIPVLEVIDREGNRNRVDTQWRKPAVYLVNGYTRSGKELLAFGAKKHGAPTVIGERTAGQSLAGRLFPLSNKALLYLAVQGCRIDGVDLEGAGVAPDIEVPFEVPYCGGQDAQLHKAAEYLLNQLKVL